MVVVALLKVVVACAAFGLVDGFLAEGERTKTGALDIWVHPLLMVPFASAGLLLVLGGRGDRGALYLGSFFIVLPTVWTSWPLDVAGTLQQGFDPAVQLLRSFRPDAFLPLLIWLFARDFPDREEGSPGALGGVLTVGGVFGGIEFGLGLLRPRVPRGPWIEAFPGGSAYSLVLVLTVSAALGYLVVKSRRGSGRSRRRFRVFAFALAAGFAPLAIATVGVVVSSSFSEAVDTDPLVRLLVLPLVIVGLWAVPFTTAYTVLVHRVLDVRLIARQALRYLLARASVRVLALLPLAALAVYLLRHREQRLVDLLSGDQLVLLIVATAVGGAVWQYRRRLLDWVDRRYFREQYDARRILGELVDRIRSSRDAPAMANLVVNGIDSALHLEGSALLLTDEDHNLLVDPRGRCRPLDASSALGRLVAAAREPLEVDLTDRRNAARRLPEEARHWLVDGDWRLLVPLVAGDGSLAGILALREKKNGLPFLGEDKELLQAIATAAAIAVELLHLRAGTPPEGRGPGLLLIHAESARECPGCGRLFLPDTERCGHCSETLTVAAVPYILPGKFRFEVRVGVGGMGLVYRASDLALGRPVAVKTLRRVSPEHALRLRREAQTAAAVSHPHLAAVFGLETWNGTPMLIMEYLENGTLAERIRSRRFAVDEVVELGVAMARALERLHRDGILHRDVKPSNIGFSRDHVPKLMDFGIARLQWDLRREGRDTDSAETSLPPTSIWHLPSDRTAAQQIVGTLSYLAPEIFAGSRVGPASDLWSLSLVIYECLIGRKVFSSRDAGDDLVNRVREAAIPDLREHRPDCPPLLAELLAACLSRDPGRRPATARELAARLLAAAPPDP